MGSGAAAEGSGRGREWFGAWGGACAGCGEGWAYHFRWSEWFGSSFHEGNISFELIVVFRPARRLCTPLMMVVEDVEIAQALLARGAQRGARNRAGQTALDIAREKGRGEIAQLLEGRAGAEAAGA